MSTISIKRTSELDSKDSAAAKRLKERDLNNTALIAPANNHLALELYKLLSKEKQNTFFSPLSLTCALAMAYHGAESTTAIEMRHCLGYDIADLSDAKLKSCFEQLFALFEGDPELYTLNCANSVVCNKDYSVKESYKAILKESFHALLINADIIHESKETMQQINSWVKEKTGGMIESVVDSLRPDTAVMILNAVYFKGLWLKPFEKALTRLQYFHNKGQKANKKEVEMMNLTKRLPLSNQENFQALQLSYKGGDINMIILLPNKRDGLEELEDNISSDILVNLTSTMDRQYVHVALPKFSLEYSKSLNEYLKVLGMKEAFKPGADFSKMVDSDDIRVTDVVQKAVIVVNEEGTEAAAVTRVIRGGGYVEVKEFIVDHPFLFVILDCRSNVILFMGRVDEL